MFTLLLSLQCLAKAEQPTIPVREGLWSLVVFADRLSEAEMSAIYPLFDLSGDCLEVVVVHSESHERSVTESTLAHVDKTVFVSEQRIMSPFFRVYDTRTQIIYEGRSPPDPQILIEFVYPETGETGNFKQSLGHDGVVLQQTENGCVAAATTMLIRRSGRSIHRDEVARELDRGDEMASLLDAKKFLMSQGFSVHAVKTRLSRIEEGQLPFLAYLSSRHLVVVTGIFDRSVLVLDPSVGRQLVKRPFFEETWTGVAIFVDPVSEPEVLSNSAFNANP